jgi:RNA polymerase sigma factor (TIGR02999 family)
MPLTRAPPLRPDSTQPKKVSELFVALYPELRQLAAAHLRGRSPTLQPTVLVHEAWLRMHGADPQRYHDRTHFLATAATVIRHLLVDHDRRRRRQKRGGGRRGTTLIEGELAAGVDGGFDLLDLESALVDLAQLDPRKARVVELRVYAGATIEETAASLGVSHMTVSSDWRMAKAWLVARLRR